MTARIGPPDLMGLVPGSAQRGQRLRVEPTHSAVGMLDGGWWPYTTDPAEELPGLILAIDPIRGPVVRLVLGAGGWRPRPEHVQVGGRRIDVEYLASQPASLLTARCAGGRRVDLLVVPPCTPRDVAARSLVRAAQAGNRVTAAHTTRPHLGASSVVAGAAPAVRFTAVQAGAVEAGTAGIDVPPAREGCAWITPAPRSARS